MPYNFENTAGYLGIRLANQQRKQALQDSLERSPADGSQELAVAQDAVGDSRKQRDMAYARDTAWGTADRNQAAILNRFNLKQDSPEVQARIANIENQIKNRDAGTQTRNAAESRHADEFSHRRNVDQFKAQIDAARTHADRMKAYAAMTAAGYDPSELDSVAAPVTVAPGQFTGGSPSASGPQPAATHENPNIQPAAQPSAPDAAQNPATAGGYNPPVSPPVMQDPGQGALLSKVGLDKVRASNVALQELGPGFSRAIKALEATKPEDYAWASGGSTARAVGNLFAPNLTNFVNSGAATLGIVPAEDAQRRQDAESAITQVRSDFNRSVSGLTVTEQEDQRLRKAFAMIGESVFNGNRDMQIQALKELEQVRSEVYARNDQIIKSRHLPRDFRYVSQGADWIEGGGSAAPQAAGASPNEAAEQQRRLATAKQNPQIAQQLAAKKKELVSQGLTPEQVGEQLHEMLKQLVP